MSVALVSASDARFFDLLKGTVSSIRAKAAGDPPALYIIDAGLTEEQRDWLIVQGAVLARPHWPYRREVPLTTQALLLRPQIPSLFPGHEIYLWIDADAWVQQWSSIELYCEQARIHGFSAAVEIDPSYDLFFPLRGHHAQTAHWFGPELADGLLAHPPLNAGVFAGRWDAPHWPAWQQRVEEHIEREAEASAQFYLDQSALNVIVHHDQLPCAQLPARHNWLCHLALPKVSTDGTTLLSRLAPNDPLGIVHMTAHTKQRFFALDCPDGSRMSRPLTYQSVLRLPPDDYISPNLSVIIPDACFPNMTTGDQRMNSWQYLRRTVPHRWYVDARESRQGFVSRDEAHILYNTALRFRGKAALEIGCLMGWSACHLALGGVNLDVIDPALGDAPFNESVAASLSAANLSGRVTLITGFSPEVVDILGQQQRKWSLFFIDGNHDSPAPLNDTIACARYAEDDCLMLFHDVAAPAVAEGLEYLFKRGWKVRLYHTAQIMAAAWRGNVTPIDHRPDPRVHWTVPEHLRMFTERAESVPVTA